MDSSGQENVTCGQIQQPAVIVSAGVPPGYISPQRDLWGSKRRRSVGVIQIICGFMQIPVGVAVICLPVGASFDIIDYVGWAIWSGLDTTAHGPFIQLRVTAFLSLLHFLCGASCTTDNLHHVCEDALQSIAEMTILCCFNFLTFQESIRGSGLHRIFLSFVILTGVVGVHAKRRKSMVNVYLANSIISAILGAGLSFYSFYGIMFVTFAPLFYENKPYPYREYIAVNFAMYVTLSILFAAQVVICLIGACFTCCDVKNINDHQQQFVYYDGFETSTTVSVQLPNYCNTSNSPPEYSPFPGNTSFKNDSHDVTEEYVSSKNIDVNGSILLNETLNIADKK